MGAGNQLAAYLPFILAVLLVGAAIIGSRLGVAARARLQRFFLMPLLALVLAGSIWLAAVDHDYPRAGILFLMIVLTLPRLFPRTAASPRQEHAP